MTKERNMSKKQIKIDNYIIDLPLVYHCEAINIGFTISTKVAKKMINCSKLKPVELFPSRSILVLTLFNFSKTPVDPYTEITYSIAVSRAKILIPFFSFAYQMLVKKISFFVHTISQSTDIAIKHGNTINGYPHYPHLISSKYIHTNDSLNVQVECQGKNVLTLDLEKPKKMKKEHDFYTTYKYQNNTISSLPMETKGKAGKAKIKSLEFGDQELSAILKSAKISKNPLYVRYYSDTTKIIHEQKVIEKL